MSDPFLSNVDQSDSQGVKFAKIQRWLKQSCINAGASIASSDPLLSDIHTGDSEGMKFAKIQRWIKLLSNSVGAPYPYTPENSANKGQPNGYAALDANAKVPVSEMPNIQDLTTTASPAVDDWLVVGGATNGWRKLAPSYFTSGGSTYKIWGYVATYADLPIGVNATDPNIGDIVGVNTDTGVSWFGIGNKRYKGYYKRSATTGVAATDYGTAPFASFSEQADQATVDAGTSDTQYVSPLTFANASKWTGYLKNNTGIAGGTTLVGGTAASETLTLSTTSNATKGKIVFGTSAYDEVNNRLGIGTQSPSTALTLASGTITIGTPTATNAAYVFNAGNNQTFGNLRLVSTGLGYGTPVAATGNAISDGDKLVFLNESSAKTALGANGSNGLWVQSSVTLANPAFSIYNGVNTGAPIEIVRIRGDGNMGLGDVAPAVKLSVIGFETLKLSKTDSATAPTTIATSEYLHIGGAEYNSNSYRLIGFGYTGSTNTPAYIGYQEISTAGSSKGELVFGVRNVTTDTQATEAVRITSAGFLGVGSSTPVGSLTHTDSSGASTPPTTRGLWLTQHSTGIHAPLFTTRKSRGTESSPTTCASGDYLGLFDWTGYVGSNGYVQGTRILSLVNGTVTNTTYGLPAELAFYTNDGTNGILERLRINKVGYVGIGTAGPGTMLDVYGDHVSGAGVARFRGIGTLAYIYIDSTLAGESAFLLRSGGVLLGHIGARSSDSAVYFKNREFGNVDMLVLSNTGQVGVRVSAPTALLHIKAGTATANTAPIKLTSGTLLATPEAGAIEFLTDDYYGTITTSAVRRLFVQSQNGRAAAQTAANASVLSFTLPATDASYQVSANVLVTTSSAESFSVFCNYTDEGNTARRVTLIMQLLAGTTSTSIASANGAVPYMGVPFNIRCKASTSITISTSGTFTGCTYNVEGLIKKVA